MRHIPNSVAALALLAGGLATPALSAQADIDLLNSYVGDWMGRGTASYSSDQPDESALCRLAINPGEAAKVTYSGRCSLAGKTLSLSGTIAYVSGSDRYEAILTTNADYRASAVGARDGDTLTFDMQNRGPDADSQVQALIAFSGQSISMDLSVTDEDTGEVTTISVPLQMRG